MPSQFSLLREAIASSPHARRTVADRRSRGITVYENIDVTSDAAVSRMAHDLRAKNISLELLFHIAGILRPDKFGSIGWRTSDASSK
jgi:hypothetical protein